MLRRFILLAIGLMALIAGLVGGIALVRLPAEVAQGAGLARFLAPLVALIGIGFVIAAGWRVRRRDGANDR